MPQYLKIKEELTINGYKEKTIHPLINIAKEKINVPIDFSNKINQIISFIEDNEENKAMKIFNNLYKNNL